MRRFPHEFEYRGYKIRKTSFNFRVVGDGLDDLVESISDGKLLIDRKLAEEPRAKRQNALDDDLSNILK